MPQPSSPSGKISIGLIFRAPEAYRLVDHGPIPTCSDEADGSPELKAFRLLWGSKAELRRFKDGVIRESVVWELQGGQRESIPGRIVRHLLGEHFGLKHPDHLVEGMGILGQVLRSDSLGKKVEVEGDSWAAVHASYEALTKKLRSIASSDEVPLAISSIQATSPYLRYTAPFPPTTSHHIPAIEFIITFEKSTRWPDDLYAVQKVKLALLEALARGLLGNAEWSGVARVVCGVGGEWEGGDNAFLEVVSPEGYGFRARVCYDREAVLLRRVINPPKVTAFGPAQPPSPHEQHLAAQALHHYTKTYIHAPLHHTALQTLHHRHPALSRTIRLAKRWMNTHLLGGSVEEEAIELMVCASFFDGGEVGSGHRGFVNFLRWLSEWDWTAGVDIPLYALAKSEDPDSGVSVSVESVAPESGDLITRGTSYHLRTTKDSSGTAFTLGGPSAVLARRITTIAQASYGVINAGAPVGNAGSVVTLFAHPYKSSGYDFLIHLKPAALPKAFQNILRVLHKEPGVVSEKSVEEGVVRVDFDPALLFYNDLVRIYPDNLFLYDTLGGSTIGAVWNPSLLEAKRWRVMSGYNTTLTQTKGRGNKEEVVMNVDAILEEIVRIGEGIVERVEVLTDFSSVVEEEDEDESEEGQMED